MLSDMPELQRSLAESIVSRRRQTMVMEVVLLSLLRQTPSSQKQSRQEALFVAFMTTLSLSYAEHPDVAWYAGLAGLSVRHFSFMIHRRPRQAPPLAAGRAGEGGGRPAGLPRAVHLP